LTAIRFANPCAFRVGIATPGLAAGLAVASQAAWAAHLHLDAAPPRFKAIAFDYGFGMEQLHLPKEDILFAAFGGWDAAGAKAFGDPTFWVNRFNQPFEELDNVRTALPPIWTVCSVSC